MCNSHRSKTYLYCETVLLCRDFVKVSATKLCHIVITKRGIKHKKRLMENKSFDSFAWLRGGRQKTCLSRYTFPL
jgi:hypothetical protein